MISGSLRAGSVNTAVLTTAGSLAGDGVETSLYGGMGELPPFNPDDDPDGGPVDGRVAELRRRIGEADALLVCTPEYAGALPGSFKNLLDWTIGGGEMWGKPVAWINASSRPDAGGAAGAHESLRAALGYTGSEVVEDACRRIVVPRSAISPDGVVSDQDMRATIAEALTALCGHAAAARSAGSA